MAGTWSRRNQKGNDKQGIKTLLVDAQSISNAVLDEHVDIYLVRRFFTKTAWHTITQAVEDKRQGNVWLCEQCHKDLNDDDAIA